jgi:hypothetical protein
VAGGVVEVEVLDDEVDERDDELELDRLAPDSLSSLPPSHAASTRPAATTAVRATNDDRERR